MNMHASNVPFLMIIWIKSRFIVMNVGYAGLGGERIIFTVQHVVVAMGCR